VRIEILTAGDDSVDSLEVDARVGVRPSRTRRTVDNLAAGPFEQIAGWAGSFEFD
jgi:hypothetical protein